MRAMVSKALVLGVWLLMGHPLVQAQGFLERAQQAASGLPADQPQTGLVRAGELRAALVAEQAAAVPGQTISLGLRLIHDPQWHTYWRNPGDSGLATVLEWALPQGWKAGEIEWPVPKRLAVGPLANFGFEGDLLLPVQVQVPADAPTGSTVQISVRASWLICRDVCIPGGAHLQLSLPIRAASASAEPSADAIFFAQARAAMPQQDRAREVSAFLSDGLLSLSWPSKAESEAVGFFYPYQEGLIRPAAAQRLSRTASGYRLDIELGESPRTALSQLETARAVSGIWVVDGRAWEWTAALLPGAAPKALELVDAGMTAEEVSIQTKGASKGQLGFALAILGALVGGLILNLMPCVFPVIGLKVLSFAQSAHSRAESVRHALIFSLGIVLSFLALAGLLLALRAAGEAIGWGFQLQSPLVVLSLALLFVVIAMNLMGVFEMGLFAARLGSVSLDSDRPSSLNSFGSGVLAVAVASPCTAPFMGGAIGFTATAGLAETLAVFTALGLGMALPYLLLSAWPALLNRLPKPGAWMLRFKQAMAFPMLAAAAWLFWVLANIQGPDVVLPALGAAVALGLGLWVYGSFIQLQTARWGAVLSLGLALALAAWAGSYAVRMQASEVQRVTTSGEPLDLEWTAWAPGLPQALQAQGKTVFVDFTAAWCITCQANKVRVLQSSRILNAFRQHEVVLIRADWTRRDADIANELARHGRNGIPLYLVYRASGGPPNILGEWLTESEVLRAIR